MRHIDQLAEFMTGKDTRIGYPNEHLANDVPDEMASPMYATGIGLVIEGIQRTENGNGIFEWQDDEAEKARETGKRRRKMIKSKKKTEPFGETNFLEKLQQF